MNTDMTIAEWMRPYLPILAAVARGLIQLAAGAGFTWALTVSADQVTMAVSAAAMLATLIWSAWQKIAAIRASRRSEVSAAVASAAAGVPVTVTETPGNLPNEAVRISTTEIAAAPLPPPVDVRPSPAPVA